jgi:hypothetical protein
MGTLPGYNPSWFNGLTGGTREGGRYAGPGHRWLMTNTVTQESSHGYWWVVDPGEQLLQTRRVSTVFINWYPEIRVLYGCETWSLTLREELG